MDNVSSEAYFLIQFFRKYIISILFFICLTRKKSSRSTSSMSFLNLSILSQSSEIYSSVNTISNSASFLGESPDVKIRNLKIADVNLSSLNFLHSLLTVFITIHVVVFLQIQALVTWVE